MYSVAWSVAIISVFVGYICNLNGARYRLVFIYVRLPVLILTLCFLPLNLYLLHGTTAEASLVICLNRCGIWVDTYTLNFKKGLFDSVKKKMLYKASAVNHANWVEAHGLSLCGWSSPKDRCVVVMVVRFARKGLGPRGLNWWMAFVVRSKTCW